MAMGQRTALYKFRRHYTGREIGLMTATSTYGGVDLTDEEKHEREILLKGLDFLRDQHAWRRTRFVFLMWILTCAVAAVYFRLWFRPDALQSFLGFSDLAGMATGAVFAGYLAWETLPMLWYSLWYRLFPPTSHSR
ncbi:MAG TPA: hypothetical protein VED40_23020 [Azospirillaceae bacterium]|nr:hypothetical protein [Azospirillaceae bacterium]